MPVFCLRSQRLRGEFLSHRLSENHGMPKEPSPILGHSAVGRTPPTAPGPLARLGSSTPRPTKCPSNLLKKRDRKFERVSIFGRTYLIDFTGKF